MAAALIAAISLLALLPPLWVSYCGTVAASARKISPSDRAKALAGRDGREIRAEDFDRVLQLVRLCAEVDGDWNTVRAVANYYRFLGNFGDAFGKFSPTLAGWVLKERVNCAHFAAVTLDRCISSNRNRLGEHAGEYLP